MPQYAARASAVALSIAALASACAKELGGGGAGNGFDAVPSADASIVVSQDGSPMPSADAASPSPPSDGASASIPEAGHNDDGGTSSETGAGEDASDDGAINDSGYANGEADAAAPMAEAGGPDASGPSCPMPVPENEPLPFAPDVGGKFVPNGYEGDLKAIAMPSDPTCGGHRANGSPLGNCHPITYTPLTGAGSQGWAGVLWQHPSNNWGTVPGYAIPPGATKVSFWAKGADGGEIVTFLVGSNGHPCSDTVSNTLSNVKLTTTFTRYEISLKGQAYAGGVIAAFGFVLAAADQTARDGGTTAFSIDDIEWQP